MSGLQVNHLTKQLAGNTIVDDVSFEIADAEFFVLLGPSGGGKTTILRLICGLEAPDSGTVVIDGHVTTSRYRARGTSAWFSRSTGCNWNMDVFHNVAYGLEARGVPKAEVRERVTQAAAVLGLSTMLGQSVVDLSGGEQQRVALARALAKDASVYLYDEPLSNLDAKLRHQHGARSWTFTSGSASRDARHPRPGRSAGHGRPHRRDGEGTSAAGSTPSSSWMTRGTCSSPGSSVRHR